MSPADVQLAQLLVARGLVQTEHLRALAARRDPRPLAELVVAEGLVSAAQMAQLGAAGAGRPATMELPGYADPTRRTPVVDTRPGSDSRRFPGQPGGSTPIGDRSTVAPSPSASGRAPRTGADPGSSPGTPDPAAADASGSQRFSRGLTRGASLQLDGQVSVTIERLLGQGGMGTVHLVRDASLGRAAALKLVKGEGHPTRAKRFRREAEVTARLDHPGIPPVYSTGRITGGQDFLLMRFVDGEALDQILDRVHARKSGASIDGVPTPDLRALLDALVKVCEAVAFAHSRGIVHRDLKPANLMIGAFGEVLVMDWGLVRDLKESSQEDAAVREELVAPLDASQRAAAPAASSSRRRAQLTQDGALLGTPGYMAPEQARGEDVDAQADVYALGAILVEVLTGEPPAPGGSPLEVITNTAEGRLEMPRQRRPDVAPELDAIAARALALDPKARYAGVTELARDLKAFLEGRPVSVHRYGTLEQTWRLVRRNPALFASLGVAFALSIVGTLAVARARAGAAQAERERQVVAARQEAEAARGASEAPVASGASPVEGETGAADERIARALAELQAAERWRVLASGDAAAARAQFDAAVRLGELALAAEQWSLAAQAFRAAGGLGVDDARAAALAAQVEDARHAESDRRRREVEAVLADAASGALAARPDGREDGLFRIVQNAGPEAAVALRAALARSTEALGASLRRAYAEAVVPTSEEQAQGRPRLDALPALVDAWLADGLAHDLPGVDLLAAADERLARRSRAQSGRSRPGLEAMAARQAREVPPGLLDAARVALDALGRLGARDAEADIGRYLAAEADPLRALPAGQALCRIGGDAALARVMRARDRYGRTSIFALALTSLLARAEGTVVVGDESARGHVRRGESHEARGDDASAEGEYSRAIELDATLAEAWNRRAVARSSLGRVREGLEDLERAVALDPLEPRFLANRANLREKLGDVPGALEDLGRAIALDPRSGFYANRGITKHRQGDLDGAAADLEQALAIDPSDVPARAARVMLLRDRDQGEQALVEADRVLALNPTYASMWQVRGVLRKELGDLEGALADLDRALAIEPKEASAWHDRAMVKVKRGDLDGARADLDEAVRLQPEVATHRRERGDVRAREGDLEGALDDLDRALEAEPSSLRGLLLRGELRARKGDVRGALVDVEQSARLAPRDARPWVLLATLRKDDGDARGALQALTRAVEAAPHDPRGWRARASLLANLGRGAEARADWDRAIELDPKDASALCDRAVVRGMSGDAKGALEDADRAVTLDPQLGRAWLNRGTAHMNLGDLPGAIADFDRAIALLPDEAMPWLNRGTARLRTGDPKGAEADFTHVIELEPESPGAHEARGVTRELRGDLENAQLDLERAVALEPRLERAWISLARVRGQRGDPRGALQAAERAVALDPDEPDAYLVRGLGRGETGDREGAIADLRRFLDTAPPGDPALPAARERLRRLEPAPP